VSLPGRPRHPCLIGRDPHRIEDIWQYLYKGAYWRADR
jgi:L-alanine-DL-glutamate epimerase-like enolase superfamily enzyme